MAAMPGYTRWYQCQLQSVAIRAHLTGPAVRGSNSPKGAGTTGTQESLYPVRQVRRASRHLSQKLHQSVHSKRSLQGTRIQCPFTNNFRNNRSDSWSPFSVKATDL